METYGSSEYVKFIMESGVSSEDSSVKITYLGYANYSDYHSVADKDKPIRKLRKIVEYTETGITETFYAEGDSGFKFKRNDRATINYV